MTERDRLVFDTFAWVEAFEDTPAGRRAFALLSTHDVWTPDLVLAELANIVTRRRPETLPHVLDAVRSTSLVLALDGDTAVAAGSLRTELARTRKGIGMVDCLVLAMARAHGAPLVTGAPHFRDLEGVRFLEAT